MSARMIVNLRLAAASIGVMLCAANELYAQTADLGASAPSDVAALPADELSLSKALRAENVGTVILDAHAPAFLRSLLPDPTPASFAWVAVVLILVLTVQAKPILSWHNFDGLILALTALLLLLRGNTSELGGGFGGQSVQWWVYLLLCLATCYWIIRGLRLLFGRTAPTMTANVSPAAMFVLVAAGLIVAGTHVASAPLSEGSRDGLTGGICFAETGKLPYGDAPGRDSRSPLLYLLHAGIVKAVEPVFEIGDETLEMNWRNREQWMRDDAWENVDPAPARLVNAVLFILLIAAAAGIGHRLHSVALGQTLAALLCFFPGALECLSHPEAMLPAVLVAWSIVFLTLPGLGGFLAVLTLALAGMTWAWAWLVMIVVLGYLLRRGWQALGALVGLGAGAALIIIGLGALTAPTLPNPAASLFETGLAPAYAARASEDGTIVIESHRPETPPAPTIKKWLWQPLLSQENVRLNALGLQFAYPTGVDGGAIACQDVLAVGAAQAELQNGYRQVMNGQRRSVRTLAAVRSVLESTWKAEYRPAPATPGPRLWDLWAADRPGWNWDLIRRYVKLAVGLLALLAALALFREPAARLPSLLGGMSAVAAAALLVDLSGPAANWVWLMPTILAGMAAKGVSPAAPPAPAARSSFPPVANFGSISPGAALRNAPERK